MPHQPQILDIPPTFDITNFTKMPKEHLSNDDFFLRLSELFDEGRKKDHGSIFLIQKRMTYGEEPQDPSETAATTAPPNLHPPKLQSMIIRATNGKTDKETRSKEDRINLSTIVAPDSLESFFMKYVEVCKSGMSGLKKRDRSKGKKKLKAKKKSGAVAPGVGDVKKS